MPEEIVKVETRIASISKMTGKDLSVKENVDAIVNLAKEVSKQEKDAKAAFEKVKDNFKRMCADEISKGKKVTCYSYDNSAKMTLVPSGSGVNISEQGIWEALCDSVGEEYDNRHGQAWTAWCEITKPVTTRSLDESKLEKVLSALPDGNFHVNRAIVDKAKKTVAPTYKASVTKITKNEKAAFDRGEAVSVKVVE